MGWSFFPRLFLRQWWEIFFLCRKLWIPVNSCWGCRPTYSISPLSWTPLPEKIGSAIYLVFKNNAALKSAWGGGGLVKHWEIVHVWQFVNTTICWLCRFFRKQRDFLCLIICVFISLFLMFITLILWFWNVVVSFFLFAVPLFSFYMLVKCEVWLGFWKTVVYQCGFVSVEKLIPTMNWKIIKRIWHNVFSYAHYVL